jgi:hypothetical protein
LIFLWESTTKYPYKLSLRDLTTLNYSSIMMSKFQYPFRRATLFKVVNMVLKYLNRHNSQVMETAKMPHY